MNDWIFLQGKRLVWVGLGGMNVIMRNMTWQTNCDACLRGHSFIMGF